MGVFSDTLDEVRDSYEAELAKLRERIKELENADPLEDIKKRLRILEDERNRYNKDNVEDLENTIDFLENTNDRLAIGLRNIAKIAEAADKGKSLGYVSDGYHTFNELYQHRALLLALLMSYDYANDNKFKCWKSRRHHDEEEFPMFSGMFIVGGQLEERGQFTYHIEDIGDNWRLFKIPEIENAPKFDGHSSDDVLERIQNYILTHF